MLDVAVCLQCCNWSFCSKGRAWFLSTHQTMVWPPRPEPTAKPQITWGYVIVGGLILMACNVSVLIAISTVLKHCIKNPMMTMCTDRQCDSYVAKTNCNVYWMVLLLVNQWQFSCSRLLIIKCWCDSFISWSCKNIFLNWKEALVSLVHPLLGFVNHEASIWYISYVISNVCNNPCQYAVEYLPMSVNLVYLKAVMWRDAIQCNIANCKYNAPKCVNIGHSNTHTHIWHGATCTYAGLSR